MATTTALALKYYPKAKPESAYRKLHELARSGYIQPVSSSTGVGFVWTLADKGFRTVKESFPDFNHVGYKSEAVGHDLLSMAAMLGEWIHQVPAGVEFFTEQELRSYDPNNYPLWVPQTDAHRADGFWKLPQANPDSSIALEVERTQKALSKYELVADFYEEYPFVSDVIWVTPMPKSKSSIAFRIQKYLGTQDTKHSFISLEDFVTLGWQSEFQIGRHTGKTLSQYLVTNASQVHHSCDSRLLLETRKKPFKFDSSSVSNSHSFFN